jgi:hypothetical protein
MFNRTHFKKFYRAKTQRKISSYFSELGVLCVFAGLIFFDSALHFLLDHFLRAEVPQLRCAQAQKTTEHLVRMLANRRRIVADAGRRLG